jgi:cell division septation protein DedD
METSGFWILPPEAEIAPLDPLPSAESPLENRPSMVSPVQGMAPQEYSEWPAFSVPVITSLEQGKYYLQLGAFGVIELIEAELSRIGKNYPLVIQPGGNSQTPIYRILLGPVTLGESGALLQQFKSLGYKDAFIRQGNK